MMRYVLHVFGDRQDELRSNNTSSRPLISCAFSPLSLSLFSMALLHSMYVGYLSLGNRRMLSKRRIRWNVRNKFPPSSPLALFARFIVLRKRSRFSLASNGQATALPLLSPPPLALLFNPFSAQQPSSTNPTFSHSFLPFRFFYLSTLRFRPVSTRILPHLSLPCRIKAYRKASLLPCRKSQASNS